MRDVFEEYELEGWRGGGGGKVRDVYEEYELEGCVFDGCGVSPCSNFLTKCFTRSKGCVIISHLPPP